MSHTLRDTAYKLFIDLHLTMHLTHVFKHPETKRSKPKLNSKNILNSGLRLKKKNGQDGHKMTRIIIIFLFFYFTLFYSSFVDKKIRCLQIWEHILNTGFSTIYFFCFLL